MAALPLATCDQQVASSADRLAGNGRLGPWSSSATSPRPGIRGSTRTPTRSRIGRSTRLGRSGGCCSGWLPWQGHTLADVGCGSGFWLPRYADAARVIGIEPDAGLIPRARARESATHTVVLPGSAEHLPLPDSSVDVAHARFAYFFPGLDNDCGPGLREVLRVLRPGGSLLVIDNDHERGEFAELLRRSPWALPLGEGGYIRQWWTDHQATTTPVTSSWQFVNRADLEAVLRLEFPSKVADPWLAEHPDRTGLSYGYLVHHLRRSADSGSNY